MTRRQDNAKGRITTEELRQALAEDRDLLKVIVEETLQQVLEAEMDEGRYRPARVSARRVGWATDPAITAELW